VVTRRTLLRGAGVTLAAGAPVLISACGDDEPTPPARTGPPDADVINGMLDLEYTAVAAYRRAIPTFRGETLRAARRFLPQEEAHAAALVKAVQGLGARAHRPKARYPLPTPATEDEFFRYIVALENTTISAYLDALTKLSDRALRATMGAILTTEAEHVAVFSGLKDEDQTPDAFVTGHPG